MEQDPHDLNRVVEAQTPGYEAALRELSQGKKPTHWMWFVFPQVAGLGHSRMAQRYSIKSRAEAHAYLNQAVLGARLIACTAAVIQHSNSTAHEIFGSPDDMKLCSSMTLFDQLAPGTVFKRALDLFFHASDEKTLAIMQGWDALIVEPSC